MTLINKVILVLSISLCFSSCENKNSIPTQTFADLDLKRGDLLLCGDPNFGEVSFSLSCRYDLRETFNLGLSLIHSFEYAEAEKAFVSILDQDSECLMAYWGTAMSILNHPLSLKQNSESLKRGEALLKVAQTLTPNNDREKDYIDAVSIYFKDWQTLDTKTRKAKYEGKMEELYNKYPGDVETAVFYSLAILATADLNDKTYSKQKKSGKILEDLFKTNPNHPGIAHYIIHNYDSPELANLALTTARQYAVIAPASAHAQHMPSHIFTRLGLWDESIKSNIDSANSAVCYAESVNPNASWVSEIHAIDYLVYAYLQLGDNAKAQLEMDKVKEIKEVFPEDHFASAYALIAIPSRLAIENKNWELATKLELPKTKLDWNKADWPKAILHFSRALGFANTGNPSAAKKELDILVSLRDRLTSAKNSYESGQVTIQIEAIKAWIEYSKGNSEEAIAYMKVASNLESKTSKAAVTPGEIIPADELLADLYLALNKPKEALETYKINLNGHPSRFNGIYGAAKAAQNLNDIEQATYYFEELIRLSVKTNSTRPEVSEAKDFLAI
ncbi:MAG: tetratricopeptide repeat protein [Flavobacteriales bacterium]|tara:strand:- start:538 stop:2217 length:1680 start_codon:yes stop_codon:yes gene_type:complete